MPTLLKAFQNIAPPAAGHVPRRQQQEFARLLFDAATAMAKRAAARIRIAQEPNSHTIAACVVVNRLIASGPRGVRANDPQTEDGLRGYLYRAAVNQLRDQLRAIGRDDILDEYDDERVGPNAKVTEPTEPEGPDNYTVAMAQAQKLLFAVVVPAAVCRSSRQRARLAADCRTLIAASANNAPVTELAEAEFDRFGPKKFSLEMVNRMADLGVTFDLATYTAARARGYWPDRKGTPPRQLMACVDGGRCCSDENIVKASMYMQGVAIPKYANALYKHFWDIRSRLQKVLDEPVAEMTPDERLQVKAFVLTKMCFHKTQGWSRWVEAAQARVSSPEGRRSAP